MVRCFVVGHFLWIVSLKFVFYTRNTEEPLQNKEHQGIRRVNCVWNIKTDTIQSREPFVRNVCIQLEYFFSQTNQIDLGNFSKLISFLLLFFYYKTKNSFRKKNQNPNKKIKWSHFIIAKERAIVHLDKTAFFASYHSVIYEILKWYKVQVLLWFFCVTSTCNYQITYTKTRNIR